MVLVIQWLVYLHGTFMSIEVLYVIVPSNDRNYDFALCEVQQYFLLYRIIRESGPQLSSCQAPNPVFFSFSFFFFWTYS